MKILILTVILSFSQAFADSGNLKSAKDFGKKDKFKLIDVPALETMMKASKVQIYDANNEKTRLSDGLIPGAKALETVSQYDVKKTLPTDTKTPLVFYCANTQCTASHTAAKRATEAGYIDVNVMSDGIQGWKKAGKPTEKYQKIL